MFHIRRTFLPLMACSLLTGSIFAAPQAAMAQSPNPHAISMYNLGLNAYKQGSPESAIIFFKRATDIDPNLADAQYNLGVLYQSQRRFKESAARFQEVLRVKPNDADAYYQLGIVNMGLGAYADAKKYFNSIAPANVHFPDAQRKSQECDAKIAAGVTAPTTPPVQETSMARSIPQTQNPPVSSYSGGGSSTVSNLPTQQPTYNPPAQSYQQPSENPAATQTAPPPTATNVVGKPTPLIANASVRVIATGFHAPSGLTFDNQGNLYVANFQSNSVDRIGRDGTRSQFASGGHLKGPIGLVADDGGNIYVANYSGGTVARITPAGISTVIATGFQKPYYLTLDKSGSLFVSQQEDNTVIRISLPQSLTARPTNVTP